MTLLLVVYGVVVTIFLLAGVVNLLLSLEDEGYESADEWRRDGARAILSAPVWPIAVVWWLVVTAFPQNEEK